MKVLLLSENLQNKIVFANHAISNKNQLPVLLNFLLEAKNNSLVIKATDLEIGISVEIPAKIIEEGETTLPAKSFLELINLIPVGRIELSTNEGGLGLIGEKIRTVFQTLPTDDFPKLYEKTGEEQTIVEGDILGKELKKIIFATSQDINRPALSGVLIKEAGEGVLLVATDGYRLSLKKSIVLEKKKKEKKEETSIIVPARALREFMFMQEKGLDIKAYLVKENNQIIFSWDGTILVGRLIEAEFPAYEKIIPTDFSTKTVFEKEDLQKAIKVCYIFARETANIVKLSILKDKIIVSANTPTVGENTAELEARTTGEENEIAFNARYLLDLLSNIDEEKMSFEMTGPLSPGVFKIENDDSFLHLIMPIRVQNES